MPSPGIQSNGSQRAGAVPERHSCMLELEPLLTLLMLLLMRSAKLKAGAMTAVHTA
jgi:hypothetical protein